jgi:hypothetical protein
MTRELWRGAGGLRAELSDLYREPHQHPELSLQEFRTARRVAGALQPFGIEVTTGVGGAGIVAVMHNGAGPTVMLRADFDAAVPLALSWHEMGDQGTTGNMSERVGRRDPVRAENTIRAGQAADRYSWMTPPRRSCRRTVRRSIRSVSRASGRACNGAAAASDR